MSDVFILSARRSAIGSFGGSLKDMPPIDLAIQWPNRRLRPPVWQLIR